MTTTGNMGLDALADAIAERVIQRIESAKEKECRLLDVNAAAKYIGRTPVALRRMIAKKTLTSVRRDGRVFLDRTDLDLWIELGKSRG